MTARTDDERRRVARNIRENYIRGGMGYRTASVYNIALAVGIVPEMLVEDIELWNRLADLIEPRCDREALLALADEMDSYTCCPDGDRCGKQMPPSTVHDYARRIRDALGGFAS